MAIGQIKVNVIDVGQGQCTFVEIYDDDGITPTLIHTLIFDCGSDTASSNSVNEPKHIIIKNNLDYIVNKALEKSPPGFDAVFFSHSDEDHINLFKYVIDEIIAKSGELLSPEIDHVWFGGNFDLYTKGKSKFNILQYIFDEDLCIGSDILGFTANNTYYNSETKNFTELLWEDDTNNEVKVTLLVANIISNEPDFTVEIDEFKTKNAVEKNRVSLITYLHYAGASFVICGDATNGTMSACNTLLQNGTTVFNNNTMTTLPHHGSRNTGFAIASSKTASQTSVNTVKTFAANMKSKTITASATISKHHHPSLQLMNEFVPIVTTPILRDARLKQTNSHRVSTYVDLDLKYTDGRVIPKNGDYTFDTISNVFSTNYSMTNSTFSYNLGAPLDVTPSQGVVDNLVAINPHACWQYTIYPSGIGAIEGYPDMKGTVFTSFPTIEGEINTNESLPSTTNSSVKMVTKSSKKRIAHVIVHSTRISNRINQFV